MELVWKAEPDPELLKVKYLTGEKLEKSAQPVSGLDAAGVEVHAGSERAFVEEDEGDDAGGLLEGGAVEEPVSMGTSSKLAVHIGPSNNKMVIDKYIN